MKRLNIWFLTTLLACCCVSAQTFELANASYASEKYDEAIRQYETLIEQGYTSVNLEYNLGNAYFRMRQLGPAILHYERALRMDPSNGDVRHNLEFAKSQTVDKIEDASELFLTRWWRALRNRLSTDGWAVLAVLTFLLVLGCLACYFFVRRLAVRKAGFSLAVVSLLVSLLAFVMATQSRSWELQSGEAVIFAPTVTLKSTPDESGTDLFILHEGTKVSLKSELGEWMEVQTEDGNTGWLPIVALERI